MGAAEGTSILEVVAFGSDFLEIFPVVGSGFVARAIDEPDFAAVAAVFSVFGEEVLNKSEYRRDSGSGGDEDAVGERPAKREEPVGPVELNDLSDFQIAQEIRKEAAVYAIYAQVERVCAGRRGDGICACLHFSPVVGCDAGDKLAGHEVEVRKLIDNEAEVVALR